MSTLMKRAQFEAATAAFTTPSPVSAQPAAANQAAATTDCTVAVSGRSSSLKECTHAPLHGNMPLASACTSRVSAHSCPSISRARPASSRHGCACGVRSPPRHRTLGTGSSASRRCGGGRAGAHGGGVRTAAPAERRRAWQRRQLERGCGGGGGSILATPLGSNR